MISGFYTTVDKPLYGQTSTAVQVKQYRELGQSGYRCRYKDESSEGEQSRVLGTGAGTTSPSKRSLELYRPQVGLIQEGYFLTPRIAKLQFRGVLNGQ